MIWQAQSLTFARTNSIVPVQGKWLGATSPVSAVSDTMLVTVSPAQIQWQRQFPVLSRRIGSVLFIPGRRMQTPRLSYDYHRGIERTHHLNQGLLAWYLAQPWMFPGDRLYDLVGLSHGTLAPAVAGSAASGWGTTLRPTGKGELRFDGSDDILALPAIAVANTSFAIAMWMHPTVAKGLDEYGALIAENNNRGLFYNQNTLNYYEGSSHRATATITSGVWTHIILSSTGNAVTFYFNGVAGGSVVYGVGSPTWNFLGSDEQATAFQGLLDDIRLYNRALTANEVTELYARSVAGHVGLLRNPRQMWIGGGSQVETLSPHQSVAVLPARMSWQAAMFPVTPDTINVQPARGKWRAVNPELFAITTSSLILAPPRLLATPRLRYPLQMVVEPNQSLNQGLVGCSQATNSTMRRVDIMGCCREWGLGLRTVDGGLLRGLGHGENSDSMG
jgi:hypothetical protein